MRRKLKTKLYPCMKFAVLINDSIDSSIIRLIYFPLNYWIMEGSQTITLYLKIVIVHREYKLEAVKRTISK